MRVLDSASPANAPADVKAGYKIHARYLTGPFALTAAERKAITGAGEGILSIYELMANSALRGAFGGRKDATAALTAARKISQPKGSIIFTTVDFDPLASQLPTVFAYCNAFVAYCRQHGYKAGVYGGASVVKGMLGKCDARWQAAGWSYGVTVPGCLLYQQIDQATVGGVTCDIDEMPKDPTQRLAWNGHGLYPTQKVTLLNPLKYTLAQWDALWRKDHAA